MSKINLEKFIEAVKKWSIVYNKSHHGYKNYRKRDKILDTEILLYLMLVVSKLTLIIFSK